MTENILESISDGVFTVDADWRITFFNRAAERITGIAKKDAVGKLCHEVFKSNMCEKECPLRRTMKTGKRIVDRKGYCLTPSGERVPISVSTALLYDEAGVAVGGAETFRDLREIEELKELLGARDADADFASRNARMRALYELLPTVAESSATVLISGETGTGKEVLAREIHRLSQRAKGPFIGVNCGALPDTLLESELFGYKKGAFTGADKDKAGRFKRAENGTLFLDEIGDVSTPLQVKLLRVLQEREYEPLGAASAEKSNARLLFATNKNLQELVAQGRFREDLFYRINVIELSLPSLRERIEDIPHLAERFLRMYARQSGKVIRGFSAETFAAFSAYSWPGNIRELANVVERAVVLCSKKEIDASLLPPQVRDAPERIEAAAESLASPASALAASAMRRAAEAAERTAILAALSRHGNRRTAAAADLGIDKATLYRKLKKYDIGPNRANLPT